MLNLLLALTFLAPNWASFSSFITARPMQENQPIQKGEKFPFKITVKFVEAFEYTSRPLGAAPNYAKGHAVVQLRVENLSQNSLNLNLLKIEIRRADNRQVLLAQPLRLIQLQGLQILDPGQHLTTREGFGGAQRLTAIVTYQFKGKNYVVESLPTEVKHYPK